LGLAALVAPGSGCAIAQTRTTLDIYVVDVEGGNATLFVARRWRRKRSFARYVRYWLDQVS
jgi:hypothetical protein